VILKRNGAIDKYVGDAIDVFWGAPLPNEKHACDAVLAALEMMEALKEFNEENRATGDPEIRIGIGLATGDVVVGNVGSNERFAYTMIGDTANLGSRIEGQTKTYSVPIIASEATVVMISEEDKLRHGFFFRELDRVIVKGRTTPIALFAVVPQDQQDMARSISGDFTAMRQAYYDGEWQLVCVTGERILAVYDDGPTAVLLERAKVFLKHPPASWNGVYELTEK
jgi:adenylate cyclase